MKALTIYRNQIEDQVAAIATPGHSFTMSSTTREQDVVEQVGLKKFPRAYIYTPVGAENEVDHLDISDIYQVNAPVVVDTWRYLQPAESIQQICDKTSDDVLEAVITNAYWKTFASSVSVEPQEVVYGYHNDRFVSVSILFDIQFYFDIKNVNYLVTSTGEYITTADGDLILAG